MMLQNAVKNHLHQHDYHIRLSDEIPSRDECKQFGFDSYLLIR